MGSGIHKTTIKNIAKILELLKKNEAIHIRGISSALGLNPFVVSNIINNYLDFFLDIKDIDQFGFRVKLLSLKEDKKNTTLEDVLKYIQIRKSIRNNT
jgi:hypothetical protein